VGETRTAEEEYATMKAQLPGGSALFIGCKEQDATEWVQYCAVIVLRGQLATVGDLYTWLNVGEQWRKLDEPRAGQRLASFLLNTQDYCSRDGSEACGERIVVERGDAETQKMIERIGKRGRYESKVVERLTARMQGYQQPVNADEQDERRKAFMRIVDSEDGVLGDGCQLTYRPQ
jgi:hypothetical protein